MKSKIKILLPTLGLILLCGIFIFVYFGKQEKPKLSELQEDQCIQYLTDNGVSIPEGLEASSVREMIAELENDPDKSAPAVSWTILADFYEDLRRAVKQYYK